MPDVSADQLRQTVRLADHTTLQLGGPARRFVTATTADEIAQSVRDAGTPGQPTLVLGGGSNVVVADEGHDGTVVLVRSRGVEVVHRDDDAVTVHIAAGEWWDDVVSAAVTQGWSGIECLSGIPGAAGATPIQNVGAYGQEIAETVSRVRVFDRVTGACTWFTADDCGFGYRTSVFRHADRWVVLTVELRLRRARLSAPVRYPELARALGAQVGDCLPLPDVRAAVLALRAGKGMVLDPTDPDTLSAGSFFTNPVLDADTAQAVVARADHLSPAPQRPAPQWPAADGRVKLSAAWLIEQAGFTRGYGRDGVAISGKHTLALTNRGAGSTAGLLSLAAEIRDGVRTRFGVTLHPEPVLVGCSLEG